MTELIVENCTKCALHRTRNRIVNGVGPIPCRILFLGEGPGSGEDKSGIPFYYKQWHSSAGKELNQLLQQNRMNRDMVYIDNVVKCRPPGNRDPLPEEMRACFEYLRNTVELVDPTVIVTIGKVSTSVFLGDVNMDIVHGVPHAGLFQGKFRTVLPVYHPAYGLKNASMINKVSSDFRTVGRVFRNQTKPVSFDSKQKKYEIVETCSDLLNAEGFVESSIIAIDTETVGDKDLHKPWCLTFSCADATGYMVKADNYKIIELVNMKVQDPNIKTIMHNALFDLAVLENMGIFPVNVWDTMIAAYLLQTEPQGLKGLAYRHLGLKMSEYSEVVTPYTVEKTLNYLLDYLNFDYPWSKPDPYEVIVKGERKMKKPRSLHSKTMQAVKKHTNDGVYDLFKWWSKNVDKEEKFEVEAVFGELVESDLSEVEFGAALNYACQDADATYQLYYILKERLEQ